MLGQSDQYDVIVVGAGNAALCAALSVQENGAQLLILERAPEHEMGGNSYFTADGFRFAHDGLEDACKDIRMALDIGAMHYGNWSGCHACEWDISAPPYGDRWVLDNFQKHSHPLGTMVNTLCERFVDEGADYRNLTYAKYGAEIMEQPQRTAIQ